MMQNYWPKYKDGSKISYLLRDHCEEIFYFYLNVLFPFRKRGISLKNPEAPTPVDFKLEYHYHYNLNEIRAVEEVMRDLDIEEKTEAILKRLLIFAIFSFGPMVEHVFGRPFAFQFSNIDANRFENGEWEVIAVISAREQ
jgi:hypothetical protein